MEEESMKGTTTVGATFADGVVLGADTRVSAGYLIAHKRGKKIFSITPSLAVSIAGVVADAQAVIDSLKYNLRLYEIRNQRSMSVKSAARLLSLILHQNRLYPLITELLVAGRDKERFTLYRLDPFGSLIEDEFAGTGSGSPVALGVLEDSYREDLGKEEAVQLVGRALISAMRRDLATGNDFDIVIIDGEGTSKLSEEEKKKLIKNELDIAT